MKTRVLQLRSQLAQANHDYHVLGRPNISDHEYDRLMSELLELELRQPELADPNSPTQRIGAPSIESFAKVRHSKKMLSLEKVFSADKVVDFFGAWSGELVAEFKLDGLSLDLEYSRGRFVRAVTRGDGETGDNVTANARTIATIPLALGGDMTGFSGHVRGEVLMSRAQLARLNSELEAAGDEAFSNCRNAAAGTMKQKDTAECAKRRLVFSAYWTSEDEDFTIQVLRKRMATSGFRVEEAAVVKVEGAVLAAVVDRFRGSRDAFQFDTDGVVFKVSDPNDRSNLGYSRTAPKWAVAFKFPSERKTTKLLGIVLTVGRTGQITPNAVLAPVSLAGASVRAASLCNADEIERLGISVGDEVVVERANEVIPKIVGRKSPQSIPWLFPSACPCCQTALVRNGVHYFCQNNDCEEQVFGRLMHAVSKGALDMDGCGEAVVRALMSRGVKTLADVFEPGAEKALDGAARVRFVTSRQAALLQPFWRKLYALGAEHVGRTASKELAARFSNILAICEARHQEVVAVIGPVACESLLGALIKRADEIDRLDTLGMKFQAEETGGILRGKTFCITGTMESGSRDEVERRVELAGGMVKGSVSKKVNYLVVGPGGGQNKAEAAAKCGTCVITESDLYVLMGQTMPQIDETEREF